MQIMEYIYKKPLMHSKGVYVHARIHTYTHTHTFSLIYMDRVQRHHLCLREDCPIKAEKRSKQMTTVGRGSL